ncbi:MAG: FAD-dependent oxidoreductase [Caldilineaceae bacterium]
MQTNTKIIILGGGFAGVMAALRLSRLTRHQPVAITLVNAGTAFVERTRQHQVASGQSVPAPSFATLLAGTGVQFVQGKATALDPVQKMVTVAASDGEQTLNYDKLIYALGSHTDVDRIPGVREHAYVLEQHAVLSEQLRKTAASHGRVLVIGGGLTGIEMATELAETQPGLQVALATAGTLGDHMSSAGAHHLDKTFRTLGIALHERTKITRLEAGQAITAAGALPFDLCVYTAGFAVAPLAKAAGLAVNSQNQVVVDAFLHSVSHPDIYAVGDAAAFEQSADLSLRMGCVTALPLAGHAADNLAHALAGQAEQPFGFGFVIRCISLGRHNGLVQFTDAADRPRSWVLAGRTGAVVKELILHFVMKTLQLEQRFPFYRWSQARKAHPNIGVSSALPAAETLVVELVNR